MKSSGILLCIFSLLILAGCAHGQQTLGEVREGLTCFIYDKGVAWKEVSEKLGKPDVYPLPEPGTRLTSNTRVYRQQVVIFHTEPQEVTEGDNVGFREVVSGVEVCTRR